MLHGVVRPPLQQAWSTQVRARGGAVGSPDERAHHQRASRRTPSSGSRGHSGCLGSFICRHSDARRRCWGPGIGWEDGVRSSGTTSEWPHICGQAGAAAASARCARAAACGARGLADKASCSLDVRCGGYIPTSRPLIGNVHFGHGSTPGRATCRRGCARLRHPIVPAHGDP